MKKLLLLIALTTTLLSNAQEQFKGVWETDAQDYLTTILSSDYEVSKIFSVSLFKNRFINENIIYQDKDTIKTKYKLKDSGYSVSIKYYFKNKDTLVNEYSGDNTDTVFLTRAECGKYIWFETPPVKEN
jgi:hypothetical protein